MKTTRLYLTSWEYNAYRIMSALAVIVKNNGGELLHTYGGEYEITNRSITAAIEKKIDLYHRAVNAGDKWRGAPAADLGAEVNRYTEEHGAEATTPIHCTHGTYIRFVFDGFYYNYSVDTNPFFEFIYTKAPVISGEYDANRYSNTDNKKWFDDIYFYCGISDTDINAAAAEIFDMLIAAPSGALVTERKRVNNTYDRRYHYEHIHTKRMTKV